MNGNSNKCYLFLDLEVDQIQSIEAIHYCIIKNSNVKQGVYKSFEFVSNSNKDDIKNFSNELTSFLTNALQGDELFILIMSQGHLEILKKIYKQNLISLPFFFNKHALVFSDELNNILNMETKEKADVLFNKYLVSSEQIKNYFTLI